MSLSRIVRRLIGTRIHLENLRVHTAPGFEAAIVALAVLIKGDVGHPFIRHELFLARVFAGEVKIRVPGARVKVDLIAACYVILERDGFREVRVAVHDVTRRTIEEGGFEQGMFGEGDVAALFSALKFQGEFVDGLE